MGWTSAAAAAVVVVLVGSRSGGSGNGDRGRGGGRAKKSGEAKSKVEAVFSRLLSVGDHLRYGSVENVVAAAALAFTGWIHFFF